MNVVLITHDSIYGRYVAATLHQAVGLDRLIVERGRASWRFYWKKLRRVGLINFGFQFLLNRWFRRAGRQTLPDLPMPPHSTVDTANGLHFGPDDLVLGFGTSYLTARTLASVPRGVLNLHTGLLPRYRGVKSEFWTLYAGDHDHAGWTLHYMTPQLDAGDIVLQHCVPVANEHPAALRAKLLRDAVPMIAEWIAAVRTGGFETITRTPQGEGRYYTTPTWKEWRQYQGARV